MAALVLAGLLAAIFGLVGLAPWARGLRHLSAIIMECQVPRIAEPVKPGFEELWNAFGAPPLRKSTVLRQVTDSEIEAQIRAGYLLDAVKLYREKNGVGLLEAKSAVEAWRVRLWAS